jgi:hypothetical protein
MIIDQTTNYAMPKFRLGPSEYVLDDEDDSALGKSTRVLLARGPFGTTADSRDAIAMPPALPLYAVLLSPCVEAEPLCS